MNPIEEFQKDVAENIRKLGEDQELQSFTWDWVKKVSPYRYTHNFSWLGRPIIQFPQDLVAIQELIWRVKPDLVIETGIAHGGSLIFHASQLAMLDYQDAVENNTLLDPANPKRKVIGIDIEIREHNRKEIEAHHLSNYIDLVEGSSIAPQTIANVKERTQGFNTTLVCLDSNHTHEHVLKELEAYGPLTSKGSYCLVMDTAIEDMPDHFFSDRPWSIGDNPKTAVWEYLKTHHEFEIDKQMDHKLLITVAPDGYLKRVG